jgi:hypothetical protein
VYDTVQACGIGKEPLSFPPMSRAARALPCSVMTSVSVVGVFMVAVMCGVPSKQPARTTVLQT